MKVSNGLIEKGVVVGNVYDKYGARNLLVRSIMAGFSRNLEAMVSQASPDTIHDVGCGEGYWVLKWIHEGCAARGTDFSSQVIQIAQSNAVEREISPSVFETRNIFDLAPIQDRADLVVCCEVLEHLEHPADALRILATIVDRYLILSVPREPVWRILNLLRGKYVTEMGNTPGHIQHWSKKGFMDLVAGYFQIVDVRTPLPWTMLLCRPLC